VTISLGGRPLAVGAAAFSVGACAGLSLLIASPPAALACLLFTVAAAGCLLFARARALAWPLAALAGGLLRGALAGPPVRDAALDAALSSAAYEALSPREQARAR
jgi:hypothetical protein